MNGYVDPTVRVCAVCGRVLDHAPDAGGWLHTWNPDRHVPVPVLPGEVPVRGVCDLCHCPEPRWEVPARDFELPQSANTRSIGAWACCDGCKDAVDSDRWEVVVARFRAFWPAWHDHPLSPESEMIVRLMFRALRANITGPVRPLTWPPIIEEEQ